MSFHITILLMPMLAVLANGQCAGTCIPPYRCSSLPNGLVWALVDNECKVFPNNCMFNQENCNRVNSCLSSLTAIDQVQCQQRCPLCDPPSLSTVCAVFYAAFGTYQLEFDSECRADKYACENSEPYSSLYAGNCV